MFKIPNLQEDQHVKKLRSDVSQGISKIGRKAINNHPLFFKSTLKDEDGNLIKIKKVKDEDILDEFDPVEQKLMKELDLLDKLIKNPNYIKN